MATITLNSERGIKDENLAYKIIRVSIILIKHKANR